MNKYINTGLLIILGTLGGSLLSLANSNSNHVEGKVVNHLTKDNTKNILIDNFTALQTYSYVYSSPSLHKKAMLELDGSFNFVSSLTGDTINTELNKPHFLAFDTAKKTSGYDYQWQSVDLGMNKTVNSDLKLVIILYHNHVGYSFAFSIWEDGYMKNFNLGMIKENINYKTTTFEYRYVTYK